VQQSMNALSCLRQWKAALAWEGTATITIGPTNEMAGSINPAISHLENKSLPSRGALGIAFGRRR
jgi:hypothetical protein